MSGAESIRLNLRVTRFFMFLTSSIKYTSWRQEEHQGVKLLGLGAEQIDLSLDQSTRSTKLYQTSKNFSQRAVPALAGQWLPPVRARARSGVRIVSVGQGRPVCGCVWMCVDVCGTRSECLVYQFIPGAALWFVYQRRYRLPLVRLQDLETVRTKATL
ncbi:hypothetical protein RRG08_024878 [Elysia crispata]|uniref:Uncharacterized protein n=1 Tax=Elysia crispata TaxID=231223 RepID=A0AAE0YK21_9GAST|nr:hypothetical protein RRG08_024878 [Elysia crispata]